tara:strand:+ start:951 stop:1130 length:180 start_codon:yes stop_codon:yes gene_type:complete
MGFLSVENAWFREQKAVLPHRFLFARSTPMQYHSIEILDRFFSTVDWPTPFTEVSSWAE